MSLAMPRASELCRAWAQEPRVAAIWRNLLIFLALNGLVRVGLVFWNQDWSMLLPWKLLPAMAIGLAFDLTAAMHLLAAAAWILALWPAQARWPLKVLPLAWMALAAPLSVVLGFTALAEFTFWLEFSSRFNFVAVDYLVYSQEVLGNIRQSYNLPLLLALGAGISLTLLAIQWRWVAQGLRQASPAPWRRRVALALGLSVLPVLSFQWIDARLKEFSPDVQLNEIAGNGYYDFFHAFRHNELDYERLYLTLSPQAIGQALGRRFHPQEETEAEAEFNRQSWERQVVAHRPERKLNVVLISIESLGASFLASHGSTAGLTPEIDALAEQGLNFMRLYATGTRTIRGLEALSLSVPPTPGHAIVARPDNSGLPTLGGVVGERGYEALYLYGGYATFDNMRNFFGGNGYTVLDRRNIASENIHHETAWGVADEDLLDMALEELDLRHKAGRRFLAHIMTTSNHRPYTYPDGRIDIPSKSGRSGGVKYTDYAIGRFIRAARAKPWFNDTLFVLVADHTHDGRGKQALSPAAYHIPMIIYAPSHVRPGRVDTLASQIDVAPTILGLLGFSYTSRFFGQDILSEGPANPRAFLANYQTVGLYRDGWVVELKPQRHARVVQVDADASGVSHQALIHEAVAHYQGAAVAYKRGWLHTTP